MSFCKLDCHSYWRGDNRTGARVAQSSCAPRRLQNRGSVTVQKGTVSRAQSPLEHGFHFPGYTWKLWASSLVLGRYLFVLLRMEACLCSSIKQGKDVIWRVVSNVRKWFLKLKTSHLHSNSSLPNDRISHALVSTSVGFGGLEEGASNNLQPRSSWRMFSEYKLMFTTATQAKHLGWST